MAAIGSQVWAHRPVACTMTRRRLTVASQLQVMVGDSVGVNVFVGVIQWLFPRATVRIGRINSQPGSSFSEAILTADSVLIHITPVWHSAVEA